MSKSDDVSQEAWNTATKLVSEIFGVGDYSQTLSVAVARAIMAAKAEERAACEAIALKASVIDTEDDDVDHFSDDEIGARVRAHSIAIAIRKRGEV